MILLCPDSFKGTMTAIEAAQAMKRGVDDILPDSEVKLLPVGDGGEGTANAIVSALGDDVRVEEVSCSTFDALRRPITASYFIAGEGRGSVAYIESAAASGLTLIAPSERDILSADTYGTGILIADAYTRGVRDFFICLGGTATCDGGYGAFTALRPLGMDDAGFTLLCDVSNPLCGPQGAAAVFAPQKGATPDMIPFLDRRLREYADLYRGIRGLDTTSMPYAGAAGGLAAMFMACFNHEVADGIDRVLDILDFDTLLEKASLIITGEGRCDATTLQGKAPAGILRRAKRRGVPVMLIGGSVADRPLLEKAGFHSIHQATPSDPSPSVSPSAYLTEATARALKNHGFHNI